MANDLRAFHQLDGWVRVRVRVRVKVRVRVRLCPTIHPRSMANDLRAFHQLDGWMNGWVDGWMDGMGWLVSAHGNTCRV